MGCSIPMHRSIVRHWCPDHLLSGFCFAQPDRIPGSIDGAQRFTIPRKFVVDMGVS